MRVSSDFLFREMSEYEAVDSNQNHFNKTKVLFKNALNDKLSIEPIKQKTRLLKNVKQKFTESFSLANHRAYIASAAWIVVIQKVRFHRSFQFS